MKARKFILAFLIGLSVAPSISTAQYGYYVPYQPYVPQYAGGTVMYPQQYAVPQFYRAPAPMTYTPYQPYVPQHAGATAMYPQQYYVPQYRSPAPYRRF